MSKSSWSNSALFAAAILGLAGMAFLAVNEKSAREKAEYLQGELKVCNAEEELSKKTTDTCLALVDVCNESLSVCVQNNEVVLQTCGGGPY